MDEIYSTMESKMKEMNYVQYIICQGKGDRQFSCNTSE